MGVLLTGMGNDSVPGLLALRQAGAATVVQDEATSVVWGMPAAASALDAATETLLLPRIADAIVRLARRPSTTPAPDPPIGPTDEIPPALSREGFLISEGGVYVRRRDLR